MGYLCESINLGWCLKPRFKSPDKFTSKDLYNHWCYKYEKAHGQEYTPKSFIGFELKCLKEILQWRDVYAILLAMATGLENGENSIRYFCENIDKYVFESEYSKYYYLIGEYGGQKEKQQLSNLAVLETKWLPTPKTFKSIKAITDRLDMWIEFKNLQ